MLVTFHTYRVTWWTRVPYHSRQTSGAREAHKSFVTLYAFSDGSWRSRGAWLTWVHKESIRVARKGFSRVLSQIFFFLMEQKLHPLLLPQMLFSLLLGGRLMVMSKGEHARETQGWGWGSRKDPHLPEQSLWGNI